MKPSRLTSKSDNGEEEREIVLDTDAEAQALAQDGTEPEESTPTSQPEDIPIQDLLSDLVGVSHRLGVAPRPRTEPASDEAPDANARPASDVAPDVNAQPASDVAPDVNAQPASDVAPDVNAQPDQDEEAPGPSGPGDPQAERPSLTGYRRYALHGLFLSLALIAAVAVLMGAERLVHIEPAQRSPIIVATVPSFAPGLGGQPETTPELTPEPPPILTPEPIPELQPAYFLYTVQPGDTVSAIAAAFAISPAYILWNNPGVIYDPDLVLVGEQLLIPSVDGIIYHAKPGDTLPDIAALYQIDVESILAFAPNSLTSSDGVIEGMILILPGAVPPLLPRPPEVVEPTASEPQPTEPTPTPEAPTPSEPQAMEPTPTAEESPSFSIGHTYP
ncbi:MAG: LysM peptidoglycan-binding domain-containing protein [Dehalococcoidia bacterium]|nr:MAG: LysM peptidoglycan-binding domain-containing protein [Dehalococcoidia bacterium]